MEIVLHTSEQRSGLGKHYRTAFKDAVELYVVSACPATITFAGGDN